MSDNIEMYSPNGRDNFNFSILKLQLRLLKIQEEYQCSKLALEERRVRADFDFQRSILTCPEKENLWAQRRDDIYEEVDKELYELLIHMKYMLKLASEESTKIICCVRKNEEENT